MSDERPSIILVGFAVVDGSAWTLPSFVIELNSDALANPAAAGIDFTNIDRVVANKDLSQIAKNNVFRHFGGHNLVWANVKLLLAIVTPFCRDWEDAETMKRRYIYSPKIVESKPGGIDGYRKFTGSQKASLSKRST